MSKRLFHIIGFCLVGVGISGCTSNPATGEKQFTALMSPQQEIQVGAQEHAKIMKQYGVYGDKKLQDYVSSVGRSVVTNTERSDVVYKFYLLDSPMVNAFALPGGYIYITRGLLALANSEAEMASVLAHETGHITARHSAERYSRGVVTSLGAMILSTAVGGDGVSQALGVGSNLYIKSYSRGQESQADSLGIRYLSRAGYTPDAMAGFLRNLQADSALGAKVKGDGKASSSSNTNYFSTHPATAERVSNTVNEARGFANQGIIDRDKYLSMLDGVTYGDSEEQGFVRGNDFYHPKLGFKFTVPDGYKLSNHPSHVRAQAKSGALIIFDFANNGSRISPDRFLKEVWMKGKDISGVEKITINGLRAATASFSGSVRGNLMQIQNIAIRWNDNKIARFQVAIPPNLTTAQLDEVKGATYSFGRMNDADKRKVKPHRIRVVVSKAGDSVASLSRRMAQSDYKEDRFRVLNGLKPNDKLVANRVYKLVVE